MKDVVTKGYKIALTRVDKPFSAVGERIMVNAGLKFTNLADSHLLCYPMQIHHRLSHIGCVLLLALAANVCSFGQRAIFTQKAFEAIKPLIGSWATKRGGGYIYESWQRKSNSEFAGKSYTVSGADTMLLETVRLYLRDGQIVYAPVTAGQNEQQEVLFQLKTIQDGKRFVFENPSHDFPQRIVYDFKSADSLLAYIEGSVNAQPKRVDYPYKRIH